MFGLFKKKEEPTVNCYAPCNGAVIPISEVPDPTFAGGLLGPGYAVEPDTTAETVQICAPVTGKLTKIFKAGHAFSMLSNDGVEILVHIGLETVDLKGEGFTKLVEADTHVTAGTPIVAINAAQIHQAGYPLVTPVVFTKPKQIKEIKLVTGEEPIVAKAILAQD